jgi:hypothetical protein
MYSLVRKRLLSGLRGIVVLLSLAGCASNVPHLSESDKEMVTESSNSEFQRIQEEFTKTEQAGLTARNQAVEAEFQRLSAKEDPLAETRDAIQQEASELLDRYKAAGPEERYRIEQRAEELAQVLKQLGY